MSYSNVSVPQVHLHWVRETPSCALQLPVSATLSSLDSLPECVRAAVLATGLPAVELHLPPFRAGEIFDEPAWFAGLSFHQDSAGRLVATAAGDPEPAATMGLHQAVVLAFRALYGDTTPLTLVAEPPPAPLLPQPLPRHHVCAPNGGLATAPAERSHTYMRCYKAVALALQAAIRDFLPPSVIDSVASLDKREQTLPLLAWSVTEPAVGRHVDELGIEVLNQKLTDRAFRGLARRLTGRLKLVYAIATRLDAPPHVRRSYSPASAETAVEACRTRSRFFRLLLNNEFRLISALIRHCSRIPGWRQRVLTHPTVVYREVCASWADLEIHLRHFYQRRHHYALGSLLLVEAARALESLLPEAVD